MSHRIGGLRGVIALVLWAVGTAIGVAAGLTAAFYFAFHHHMGGHR